MSELSKAQRGQIEAALSAQWSTESDSHVERTLASEVRCAGKRVRPLATLVTAEAFGANSQTAMPYAVAIELVHTASLILDDLPSMDAAQLRRGQPALHLRIGEGEATLVAVAMLSRAFTLAAAMVDESKETAGAASLGVSLTHLLEAAVGANGMCEGQSRDLQGGAMPTPAELLSIHSLKTGALFTAAIVGGGTIGGADAAELEALASFSQKLGLTFQVADDLLDADGTELQHGKDVGRDAGRRPTFVTRYGLEGTRAILEDLEREARSALAPLGEQAQPLLDFAEELHRRRR